MVDPDGLTTDHYKKWLMCEKAKFVQKAEFVMEFITEMVSVTDFSTVTTTTL